MLEEVSGGGESGMRLRSGNGTRVVILPNEAERGRTAPGLRVRKELEPRSESDHASFPGAFTLFKEL